jgi:IAA-amino acid hydrolase
MLAVGLVCVLSKLPGFSSKLDGSKVASAGDADGGSILHAAAAVEDWTIKVRRDLHKMPELLYDLERTSAYVRARLDELGIPYTHPIASTGIVATIGTGKPPCVGLRADMDALPIEEEVQCAFRSVSPGKMHACGHDAHTAMLLTAGRLLKAKERDGSLKGTVKLIFQPAEEGGAGGLAMVQAGVLQSTPRIERIFALHVWPGLPAGVVASRDGTIMVCR